jgi:hypothetical protein
MATPSEKAVSQKIDPSETKTKFLGNDTLPGHDDAADKKLMGEMRGKNTNETTFDFTLEGDTVWMAGITVNLDSTFGVFTGKYFIDKVVHRMGRQGYTSAVEGHKCLKGHDKGTAPKATPAKTFSPGSSVAPALLGNASPTPLATQLGGAPKTFVNPATGNIETLG